MIKLLRPFWNFSIGLMFFSCSGCFSVSDEMNDQLRNRGAMIKLTNLVKVPQTWTSRASLFSFLRQYFDVSTLRAAVQRFFVYGIYWLISYKEKSQPCCSHVLQKIIKKNYNPIMGCEETTLFSPDLEKLVMNYCNFDDCLEILSWKDFLSVFCKQNVRM